MALSSMLRRLTNLHIFERTPVWRWSSGIPTSAKIFDRKAKRLQKDRAASTEEPAVFDYLKDHVASSMVDRMRDIDRFFPVGLDLGCGRGHIAKSLSDGMVRTWIQCDLSGIMVRQSADAPEGITTFRAVVDEEFLPFKPNSLDLVISSLSLHWVNDLPETLKQICNCLKEDGVFIGAMFGSDTLYQLRVALQLAETERRSGFAPHVSPFAGCSDVASLLTSAGFTITTVDVDEIVVNYPSIFELMHDLRGMGESNAALNRGVTLRRDTLLAAAAICREYYGSDERGGSIPATFHIVYMIGWKPGTGQPKPAARGSATVSFKDLQSSEPSSNNKTNE